MKIVSDGARDRTQAAALTATGNSGASWDSNHSKPVNSGEPAWIRMLSERLSEPLHLNLLSLVAAAFGSFRTRVAFDVVRRRHYAFGLLRAADHARRYGIDSIAAAEFGVSAGAGLINLGRIGLEISKATGVRIRVFGFDTGAGLPPPKDYRDHPELFQAGDFTMDVEKLRRRLPENTELVLGDVANTVIDFRRRLEPSSPLAFAAIDVDYYSSARAALAIFGDPDPRKYVPLPIVYLDDVTDEMQNSWCGELLAVNEFNSSHRMRKIEIDRFLRSRRIFKQARWIDQIYLLHVLDHPALQIASSGRPAFMSTLV
jgi:hypothetical protein